MDSRVSKIYGDAYVSVKAEETDLQKALDEVQAVRSIFCSDPELIRFLCHPQVTKEEKMNTVEKIFQGRVCEDLIGFLMIIIKKGRCKELEEIFGYVAGKIKKLLGIGELHVTSAVPLKKEQKEKIQQKVLESSEYEVLETTYEVDETIIGGLILRMDDRIVDNSISTRLSAMGKHLSQIQL